MDDIGEILYILFIIIIFIISAIRKGKKTKSSLPVPKPKSSTLTPIKRNLTPAELIERELAKMLGVEKEPTPIPTRTKPKPYFPAPPLIPEQTRMSKIPTRTKKATPKIKLADRQQEMESDMNRLSSQLSFIQERIIWAEILGPPKALRHGRIV